MGARSKAGDQSLQSSSPAGGTIVQTMRRNRRGTRPLRYVAAATAGYLAGSVPSADLVATMVADRDIDLRAEGSGNPGGSNVGKLLGAKWGLAVMAADVAKGAVGATAGRALAGGPGASLAGTAAVVGHCFPVWTGFRGGKGVATSAGQMIATFPVYAPIDLGLAVLAATSEWWKPRALLVTATASVMWVGAAAVWSKKAWPNLWGPEPAAHLPIAASASSVVIIYKFIVSPDQSRNGS
jgi:glycerol-3-phosphate acyltransferase PlsY